MHGLTDRLFGPRFDIKRYEFTFRVFYFCFGLVMFPYVAEAFVYYGEVPDRFLGNFYFGPFWMGWGVIALLSCLIAVSTDSIRAQGMCISLVGTWFLFRILQNVVDGADAERYYRACQWLGWFIVCCVLSFHMSRTRPSVKYMSQMLRERQLEQELYLQQYERASDEKDKEGA